MTLLYNRCLLVWSAVQKWSSYPMFRKPLHLPSGGVDVVTPLNVACANNASLGARCPIQAQTTTQYQVIYHTADHPRMLHWHSHHESFKSDFIMLLSYGMGCSRRNAAFEKKKQYIAQWCTIFNISLPNVDDNKCKKQLAIVYLGNLQQKRDLPQTCGRCKMRVAHSIRIWILR
jgi:hypothetical protein